MKMLFKWIVPCDLVLLPELSAEPHRQFAADGIMQERDHMNRLIVTLARRSFGSVFNKLHVEPLNDIALVFGNIGECRLSRLAFCLDLLCPSARCMGGGEERYFT